MQPSVLVTRRIYPEAIEYLKQHAEVDYNPTDDILSPADLLARAKGKQAIVSQLVDKFTPGVIAQLGVRIIANVAVGFDNIDIPAATERGILVTNTPDVLTDTTADFAFALLMAAARRIVEAHEFVHAGKWERWTIDMLVGQDVHHRTLGIFGMGRIGQAMARRGKGFDMRVIYHDAQPANFDAEFASKEKVLRESDFISLHVPLTPETRHYIGEPELRMMKPTAILINTARGPVVDEAALARALKEGWIGGAGIDVFEREPAIDPDLLKCRTATLAPHIGSASVETRRGMSMIAVENAVAALEGRRPKTLLNPLAWEKVYARKEA
ncbi:MAG: D-glycerate dehydrogenase [Acidobacteriia bacterium]|nr:D-glycerate dehydrogenase [Terriglobia bacterium]